MKIREHRSGFDESMATVQNIIPMRSFLAGYIHGKWFKNIKERISPEDVTIEPYGYDKRNGWDTYIVSVKGLGVFGFTDGPVHE